jgi:hypothetical protein
MTSCPSGHPYTKANARRRRDRPGPQCWTCLRDRANRVWRQRIASGLCGYCGVAALESKTRCSWCLGDHRAAQKVRRAERREGVANVA